MSESNEPKDGPATLPALDCGQCGFCRCADLAARLTGQPDLVERRIQLSAGGRAGRPKVIDTRAGVPGRNGCIDGAWPLA